MKKEDIIDEIKKYKCRVSNKRILFLRSSTGLVKNFNLPCSITKDIYIYIYTEENELVETRMKQSSYVFNRVKKRAEEDVSSLRVSKDRFLSLT